MALGLSQSFFRFTTSTLDNFNMRSIILTLLFVQAATPSFAAEKPLTQEQGATALRKAVAFFRKDVSASGGYLWRYSRDLKRREGEGKATPTMAWVQPPGTPTVGDALLRVYHITKDEYYLDAARETAYALVNGQLRSGGWGYTIEFDPKRRKAYNFRVDDVTPKSRNTTTLDDDTTQSALRFLMRADQTLEFLDNKLHSSVEFALKSLLQAQYPNGAWPQRYDSFPDPKEFPVKKASYPKSWSRTWPKKDYRSYYTFNDDTIADTIDMMFQAADTYQEPRYTKAAIEAGGFILLAQMPEPQPAWAQQYDADMHPAWARKFEPPSVSGGESRGVMRTLMYLYRRTGDKKWLEPIPRALAYAKKSELPGNRMARFYELKTNKPLYFTKDYKLTYSSNDMPTHYGFIVGSYVKSIEAEYQRMRNTEPASPERSTIRREGKVVLTPSLTKNAQALIDQMDDRGAWVEEGSLRAHDPKRPTEPIITTTTFAKNIVALARFVAAVEKK